MIDLKSIHVLPHTRVLGRLDDGRFVEFKASVPHKLDKLVPHVVAMANAEGGLIILGIDNKTLSITGLSKGSESFVTLIDSEIKNNTIGVDCYVFHELVDDKGVIIIEVKKSKSTSYFSRLKSSPNRQIAYKFKERDGKLQVVKDREMRYSSIFKYMTVDAFLTSIYCSNWRFSEPSKWSDKYEQRFYCANYQFNSGLTNPPQLFAACVTREKNSEAAWKVYCHGQGLGAHCLQLELDVVELRKQLRNSGYKFEEKAVEYISECVILNLHKKKDDYDKYFSPFTLDTFLDLLSLKRDAYTYEKEIRLFIIPDGNGARNKCKKAKAKNLDVDWAKLIKRARVDKKCSDAELASIQRACASVGINAIIKKYKFPGKIKPTKGFVNVEFERYNIDDMPGNAVITIS